MFFRNYLEVVESLDVCSNVLSSDEDLWLPAMF